MIEWYKMAFYKYADFKTRSTRNEFWWFMLCHILVIMLMGSISDAFDRFGIGILAQLFDYVYPLYLLAVTIPILALTARRFHDTNRSGLSLLFWFIPLVGAIIVIVFLAQKSHPDKNRWGPGPRTAEPLEDALIDIDEDYV